MDASYNLPTSKRMAMERWKYSRVCNIVIESYIQSIRVKVYRIINEGKEYIYIDTFPPLNPNNKRSPSLIIPNSNRALLVGVITTIQRIYKIYIY